MTHEFKCLFPGVSHPQEVFLRTRGIALGTAEATEGALPAVERGGRTGEPDSGQTRSPPHRGNSAPYWEELTSLFETLGRLMDKTGSDFTHLAKATYYLADGEAAKKIYRVRPKFYDPTRPPAASLIHVVGAGARGKRVTLDMIAIPKR